MAPTGAAIQGPSFKDKLKDSLSIFNHVRWEHLVAGITGGVTSTLVLHPLDLIKVRFQVNEGLAVAQSSRPQYNGVVHAFATIARTEGVKGLYKGVTPNVWGTGASWGLYFLFYNTVKGWMLESNPSAVTLEASQHMLAAAGAGVITLSLTNPVWVAKTRLCLQYEAAGSTQYRGLFDCLYKISTQEGIRGLYRGFLPGIIGVSHGVVQFVSYEELKKRYNLYKHVPLDSKFTSLEYISFAALSKVIAASSTYPYQVVRSRLQDQHRSYTGVLDVIRQTWRSEGAKGFYKGLFPSLIRVVPACCITFLVYENMINYLQPPVNGHRPVDSKTMTDESDAKIKKKDREGKGKDKAGK